MRCGAVSKQTSEGLQRSPVKPKRVCSGNGKGRNSSGSSESRLQGGNREVASSDLKLYVAVENSIQPPQLSV